MTGIERMQRILQRKKADRIGLFEHFWNDTHQEWVRQGSIQPDDNYDDLFGFDMSECWALNLVADLDFTPVILEETESTYVQKDGNGATLRRSKLHDTTPEHIDFEVKTREKYEEIRHMLVPSARRMNGEAYAQAKRYAAEKDRFFVLSGVNVFEAIHPLTGHEHMLIGMVDDPEWIADMAMEYARLIIALQEELFAKYGKPDGIWYYEDMGFKDRPFFSPAMYRELIYPAHKLTIDYAKSLGLPVIMHSCGFVEPLLPDMVKAGIDMLEVIEVKAGMDLLRIYRNFGDVLSLMGGIDVRALYTNDRDIIEKELQAKVPIVKEGFGYALHSDHSIPNTVHYDTFRFFIERGLELGQTP